MTTRPRLVSFLLGPWHAFSPVPSLLKNAHARFHRISIEKYYSYNGFSLLDGMPSALHYFEEYDLKCIHSLLSATPSQTEVRTTVRQIDQIVHRSKLLFSHDFHVFVPSRIRAWITGKKLDHLKENEILLVSGITRTHAILFEVKRTGSHFHLKEYNSGEGAEKSPHNPYRFVVPLYTFQDKEDIKKAVTSLVQQLRTLPAETLSTSTKKIISSYGGIRQLSDETHGLQDRGNCTWKCVSTCLHQELSNSKVDITQELVTASSRLFPTLPLNRLTGQSIPLFRLMKMLAQDRIRAKISHCIGRKPISQKAAQWTAFLSILFFWEKIEFRPSYRYVEHLLSRILTINPVERYAIKDSRKMPLDKIRPITEKSCAYHDKSFD